LLGEGASPPGLTLVLGGARSGKSRMGERLALGAGGGRPVYVATAQAFDDEMRQRIAEHRARRGDVWRTVEAPIDLARALAEAGDAPVLVDCLTLWLSNLMLAERDIEADATALQAALAARAAPTVLVSNEVGLGIVPETPLGRRFRDAQGRLNQQMAAAAGVVVFMAAGLPLVMKGGSK